VPLLIGLKKKAVFSYVSHILFVSVGENETPHAMVAINVAKKDIP
jgi:hypothetical protein